jgi:hypothetical protein
MRPESILAVVILSAVIAVMVFAIGYYRGKRKAYAMINTPEGEYVMANLFLSILKAFDENKLGLAKDGVAMMARNHVRCWRMYERSMPANRLEAIRKRAPNLGLIDDAEKWCGTIDIPDAND